MLKIVGRVLVVLSLSLLIATAGMWARSQWVFDSIFHYKVFDSTEPFRDRRIDLYCFTGSIAVDVHWISTWIDVPETREQAARALVPRSHFRWNRLRPSAVPGKAVLGFHWDFGDKNMGWPAMKSGFQRDRYAQLVVPWWFLAGVFAIAPGWSLWRRVKRNRRRPGCCPACGYDLRASPERCPECGRERSDDAVTSSR